MRRLVLGIVFLMSVTVLYSQNPLFGIPDNTVSPIITMRPINEKLIPAWNEFNGIVLRNVLYVFIEDTKGGIRIPIKITKGNLLVNGDGYYMFTYEGRRFILLAGGDLIIPIELPYNDQLEGIPYPPPPNTSEIPILNVFWFWDDGIQSIEASSALKETTKDGATIVYDKNNLRNNFHGIYDSPLYYNSRKRAWAEGVVGAGKGECLDIEFREASDHMMVINGYVNIFRMDLYKANNRVKQARILSEAPSFSITYTFEDVVRFHEIRFPKRTKKIRFILEDVYKGSRFDDTCITGIYLKQKKGFKTHEYFRILDKGSSEYTDIITRSEEDLRIRGYIP